METKGRTIKSDEMLYYASELGDKKFFLRKNKVSLDDLKKMHTKYMVFLFVSIALAVLFAISLYYNLVGGFAFERIYLATNQFGQDSTIKITNYGSSSVSYNFSGSAVNGLDYSLKVTADVTEMVGDCKLRAKAYITFLTYVLPVQMYGYTNWEIGENNYYYLNQTANQGDKIGVCLYVTMPEEELFDSQKQYILTIAIEAVNPEIGF